MSKGEQTTMFYNENKRTSMFFRLVKIEKMFYNEFQRIPTYLSSSLNSAMLSNDFQRNPTFLKTLNMSYNVFKWISMNYNVLWKL